MSPVARAWTSAHLRPRARRRSSGTYTACLEPDLDQQQLHSPAWTFALVVLGLAVAKGSSMLLPAAGAPHWESWWGAVLGPTLGLVGGIGMLLCALPHRLRDKRSRAYVWLRRVARLCAWALALGVLWQVIKPYVW